MSPVAGIGGPRDIKPDRERRPHALQVDLGDVVDLTNALQPLTRVSRVACLVRVGVV